MGRPRTILVSPRRLLARIAEQILRDVDAADRALAAASPRRIVWVDGRRLCEDQLRRAERRRATWAKQDLDAWAGRRLTASERIRWQQAVVRLIDAGLIDRDGRRVSVTEAGWQAVGLTPPQNCG